MVFWVMTPCSNVGAYQRFGGPRCLLLQTLHPEDEGSMVLRNVGILSHDYTIQRIMLHPSSGNVGIL